MSFIISVLKTGDLGSIRRKLNTLYILNVTDILFTIFLVNTGMFVEANAVMTPLVNNKQLLSVIIKLVIPFVLLVYIYQSDLNFYHIICDAPHNMRYIYKSIKYYATINNNI